MKRRFLLCLVLIILVTLVGFACQSPSETTSIESATVEPGIQPIYGGTLRILTGSEPVMLGYPPLMGPEDFGRVIPGVEMLMNWATDREQGNSLEPMLAERVLEDTANNRIVFYLRPEVKFHDGSDLNADNVIWNFELLKNAGTLHYSEYWKDIKRIDDLTFEIEYSEYNNQLVRKWGTLAIFSKEAWENASGGDVEKGIDWARNHVVGTGPFVLQEFKRSSHMVWAKNEDYWQEGKPYLDGIKVHFIPDSMTARMTMLAGEADYWEFSYSLELEEQGFDVWRSWHGIISCIWPNTADPESIWNDIRLRQALEYAIDKKKLTETFGTDTFIPMKMVAPEGEWGYDPDYPTREYDPEKARQLVIEAGYSDGLDAELLINTARDAQSFGVMLKEYFNDVGIRIELDMADPGRFFATIYGDHPGSGLVLSYYGMDVNFLANYMNWFSTEPLIEVSYLGHTEEQRALDKQAMSIPDVAGQQAITGQLVRYITDNAMVIPIVWFGMRQIVAPYVHGPKPISFTWHTENLWMEKR